MSRQQSLALFRRILREGRRWQARNPSETDFERRYIRDEAYRQFRRNQHAPLAREDVERLLFEGNVRLSIALHYQIPYPRLLNVTDMDDEAPGLALPHASRSLFESDSRPASADDMTLHDEDNIYFDEPNEGSAPIEEDNPLRRRSSR